MFHIPLVIGAVVPIYNLPDVDEPLVFAGAMLADIYLGKIKRWDDDAIQRLNPGVKLPPKAIGVVHRSDGSGTTYIWVDYLAKVSPEWRSKVGVATAVDWPIGEGAKGNENVAGRVKATVGSIGYIELTYALQTNIKFGLVMNKEGFAIKADLKSVTAAADHALKEIPNDLRFSLTDAAGKDSYPIAGANWAVLYVKQPSDKGKQVVEFLRWCTHEGQTVLQRTSLRPAPAWIGGRVSTRKLDLVETK